MAAFNIVTYKNGGYQSITPITFKVAAGATTINPGEPVVASGLGASQTVAAAATGTPVVGTDYFVGIASSKSTQTASVAGTVEVLPLISGQEYLISPTTAANFDTQAEYDARVGRRVLFGLSGGVYTIGDTDNSANGLVVVWRDITDPAATGKVAFTVRNGASVFA